MDPPAAALEAARAAAVTRADAELQRLGFLRTEPGWVGDVSDGHQTATVTIRLPTAFPDALPEVSLRDSDRYPAYAHIERSGKLCLAPPTGTLIDDSRPEQVIVEAIQRARPVLFPTEAGHVADLKAEFSAYWSDQDSDRVFSICSAPVSSGEISLASINGGHILLAAPDRAAAERWASRVGKKLGQAKPAFAVALKNLFTPPRFTARITLGDLLRVLDDLGGAGAAPAFRAWLNETGLPVYLLASASLPSGGDVEMAALIRDATGKRAGRWEHGFRPGMAPRSRQIAFAGAQPITRLDVQRLDPAFLVERGGGSPGLLDKTVVVIGCGAVGGHVAVLLAATGIGNLRLIDPEVLGPENIHRHVLGTDQVGRLKVDGLRELIQRRYPNVDVVSKSADVLVVLAEQSEFVTAGADAVVVAVGDETIERRLNRVLPPALLRVHVWLEPLGLGGHTLATGLSRPGCYECLYRIDEEHGLVNMASLAAPGQFFQRTIAGCGGTFTPFGATDAVRAAVEAVQTTTELILERGPQPLLTSWVTSTSSFITEGHRLSALGAAIERGCLRPDAQFAQPTCAVCAQW